MAYVVVGPERVGAAAGDFLVVSSVVSETPAGYVAREVKTTSDLCRADRI
jgi:hypothetical protein